MGLGITTRVCRSLVVMLGFFLLPPWAQSETPVYDTCCFCVRDQKKPDFFWSQCREYFNSRQCGVKAIWNANFSTDKTAVERLQVTHTLSESLKGARCRHVDVRGAFHGYSGMHEIPFELAHLFTTQFQPSTLCYDGASCLIFNNRDDVKNSAAKLQRTHPDTRFKVSGDQNLTLNWTGKPASLDRGGKGTAGFESNFCRERYSFEFSEGASNLTVHIDRTQVHLQFSECSKSGMLCAYVPLIGIESDWTAKTNPNKKVCLHEGILVEQECCPLPALSLKVHTSGKWAKPAEDCPSTDEPKVTNP